MFSSIFQYDHNPASELHVSQGIFQSLFSQDYQSSDMSAENEFFAEFSMDQEQISTCTFEVEKSSRPQLSRKPSSDQSTHDDQTLDTISSKESVSSLSKGSKLPSTAGLKSELLALICRLLDRKPIKFVEIEPLDPENILILSNFTKLLYQFDFNSTASLFEKLEKLNHLILTTKEKKKRNEERIKYTFKRVNKILLKRFSTNERESDSDSDQIQSKLVAHYFGSDIADRSKVCSMLFCPTNLYRNDLKSLFNHRLYKEAFSEILETIYLEEFAEKRLTVVDGYIKMLKEEIYYAGEAKDSCLLSKKLTRMPWSIQEVQRGMEVLSDILRNP